MNVLTPDLTRVAEMSPGLGEPSFADVLAAISVDEIDVVHKRHWSTSLRQMERYLDRPAAALPARITAIRPAVMRLHPDALGVNAKTFANHRSTSSPPLIGFGTARARAGPFDSCHHSTPSYDAFPIGITATPSLHSCDGYLLSVWHSRK